MNFDEPQLRSERNIDRSPVISLLLAQYKGIQTERIVVSTSMRLSWFLLLLFFTFARTPLGNEVANWFVLSGTLFFVSFYSTRRTERLEASIRSSLVRLDPDLEDFYIQALDEARDRPYSNPLEIVLAMLRRGEDLFWLMSSVYILVLRMVFRA